MTAVVTLVLLATLLGAILGYAAKKFRVEGDPVVDQINALLPQTQCGQCNFPGCKPYAKAIANNEADINQCPPGGETTIRELAQLLDREPKPLNAENGSEKPFSVAIIDESLCIGCTLCIKACPVDAIMGTNKRMHTVIATECTGCELCVPPCPVDCIDMIPAKKGLAAWHWPYPNAPAGEL